jgi:diguanylate cyclase (GGDEF)-like protein/PAS domain S-box-containing protein
MPSTLPSESLLNVFLSNSGESVVGFQLDGSISLWNRTAERLYGYPESEVLGKPITILVPRDEIPAVKKILKNPALVEQHAEQPTERLARSGNRIPVRLSRSLVRAPTGEIMGILERAQAAASLASVADAHLRLIVRQMPVTFWTTDLRLCITSHWGSNFPQHSDRKLIGYTLHEYLRCTKSEDTPVKQHLEALAGISSRLEYRHNKRFYELSIDPFRDAAGKIIGCAGLAHDVTKRKRSEQEILDRASRDGLTGLANYRDFLESLEREIRRAARTHQSFAILLLDLNGLKSINDRFGHIRGNLALKRLARVLKESCRNTDLAGRFGGDEFAVLMIDADDQQAWHLAERISNCLSQQPETPALSVSIGLAIYPQDGSSAHEMLECADKRMYKNKKSFRARDVSKTAET